MNFSLTKIAPHYVVAGGLILFALLFTLEVRLIVQKRTLESGHVVESTIRMTEDVQTLLSKTLDAKLAETDFLYTGDTDELYLYTGSAGAAPIVAKKNGMGKTEQRTIFQIFEEMHALAQYDSVADNKNVKKFELLVRREFEYISQEIRNKRAKAGKIKNINEDNETMAELRTVAALTVNEEKTELAGIMQTNEQADRRLDYSIVATTLTSNAILLAAVFLIIGVFFRIRRTERELHAKEAYFRAAAEGTLDAFFIFRTVRNDRGGIQNLTLAHLNPAAERMLAAMPEDVIGRAVGSVLPSSADKKDIKQVCTEVLQNSSPQESEYVAVSGPAAGRSFQQQIIPLPDGVAVTCRDITERKRIERMKNEFVSTVSHELRTPLTSIRGSLGLITGGVAGQISDQAKGLLTIAYNNCERLVRLINHILDIEKIESGGMVLQMRAIPLLPLVRQVMEANQSFAEKYRVSVILESGNADIQSDEVMVTADSDRLAQVLTNLLSNAVKFSHTGGKVVLRCREEGGRVRIEVEDHGGGIPKDFQSRIFEKFAQADSSDTRQKGGTGLGLSIVKAIVEEMNGEIGFESEPGKGTTFYFALPMVSHKAIAAASSVRHVGTHQRILICEDEPDISHLLTLILERAGFAVDVAPNAAAAVAMLRQQSYLAMTLDLALPDKDGITLIKELRDDPRFASLPIIVVSVKAEEGRLQIEGDAFGIADWLKKPIDMDRLVDIVQGLYAAYNKPRILHVEDDNDIVEILRLSLADISEFVHASTLKDARKILASENFNLVILDINLPDGQGTDLLPLMVDRSGKAVPVVLFTAIEVPQDVADRVAASLTKSRTSEEKLIETIKNIIKDGPSAKTAGRAA